MSYLHYICTYLLLGTAMIGSYYGKPNAPLLQSNTDCVGNEHRLDACQSTPLNEDESQALYSKAKVAGVRCTGSTTTQPVPATTQPAKSINSFAVGLAIVTVMMFIFMVISVR